MPRVLLEIFQAFAERSSRATDKTSTGRFADLKPNKHSKTSEISD
jgi:hypothetical protein